MSKFNVGDRVRVIKANFDYYVGLTATVTNAPAFFENSVSIKFDEQSVHDLAFVQIASDGSVPWMEEWLEKA